MRAKQERAKDKQAELDQIKAMRALRDQQRRELAREEEKARAREEVDKDIVVSRNRQIVQKEQRIKQQAWREKEEFGRILEQNKMLAERERLQLAQK